MIYPGVTHTVVREYIVCGGGAPGDTLIGIQSVFQADFTWRSSSGGFKATCD
jgi:hypothetical protein